MSITVIPAGYRFTIHTWENDMDSCSSEILEGLSLETVSFYVELAKLFRSSSNNDGGIGNIYEPGDEEMALVADATRELFTRFPDALTEGYELSLEDLDQDDIAVDTLTDIGYNLGLTSGEFFTRVCDSYKVEYIPTEIHLEDVTDKFK